MTRLRIEERADPANGGADEPGAASRWGALVCLVLLLSMCGAGIWANFAEAIAPYEELRRALLLGLGGLVGGGAFLSWECLGYSSSVRRTRLRCGAAALAWLIGAGCLVYFRQRYGHHYGPRG